MNLTYLLIIGFLITFAILVWKNPTTYIKVLLVLSVLVHKELFSIQRWDLLPIRLAMLVFLVYSLILATRYLLNLKTFKQRVIAVKTFLSDPFTFALVALWFIRGASLIFSKNLTSSVFLFGFFTTIVAIGLYIYKKFAHDPQAILNYIKLYIIIGFSLGVFCCFQFFIYTKYEILIGAIWNIPDNLPRVGATFWDVNHFAALLAGLLPIIGVLLITPQAQQLASTRSKASSKKTTSPLPVILSLAFRLPSYLQNFLTLRHIGLTAAMLLLTGILFLTNSRSAWIAGFVALLTFASLVLIKRFSFKGILVILASLLIITIPLVREYNIKSSPIRAEIKHYFHYRIDSFASHFMLLRGAFEIFEKYPMLGGGYGSFFEHFSKTKTAAEYFGRDPAALNTRVPAHTIWGELVAETGILGFSAFLLFITCVLFTLIYASMHLENLKDRLLTTAMAASITGWMIAGIFYSYNTEFFWILIFLYFTYSTAILGKSYNPSRIFEHFIASEKMAVSIIVLVAGVLIFTNLGINHLIPWDEAIYAKVAKNMVTSGEYITQYWKPTIVWYEKPPLYMWLVAGFMQLLGINELAARLPSALCGFSTIIVIYLFGKRLFNRLTGLFAAITLITTFHFLYYARASMLDVTTTFFITLSLYLWWGARSTNKKFYWILSGVSTGLGVMTKGIIGFLPLLIITLTQFIDLLGAVITKQQINIKKVLQLNILFILGCLLMFLPWHLAMYSRFGKAFITNYIGYHVIDRATSAIEDKGRPTLWYLEVMKVSMRLWFIALIPSILLVLLNRIDLISKSNQKLYGTKVTKVLNNLLTKFGIKLDTSNKTTFLLVWFIVVLVFFSAATSKLIWYIMPIYPVTALIIGYVIGVFIDAININLNQKTIWFKLFMIYLIFITAIMYLFINKNLVYLSDLTGAQATLLMEKDTIYGTTETVYVDLVELPLILFYTDGPFEVMDYRSLGQKLSKAAYNQTIIFITKESRFRNYSQEHPNLILAKSQKEWVLGRLPSKYSEDTSLLETIQTDIRSKEETISKKEQKGEIISPDEVLELENLRTKATQLSTEVDIKLKAL